MNMQVLLLNLNAIVCFIIAIRSLAWRVFNRSTNLRQSFLMYFLVISCATISIRTLTGGYLYADWAESIINTILCFICIFKPKVIYHLGESQ